MNRAHFSPPFPGLPSPPLQPWLPSEPPVLYWCVFYPPFDTASRLARALPAPRALSRCSHTPRGPTCARAAARATSLGFVASLIEPQPISAANDAPGVSGITGGANTRGREARSQLGVQGLASLRRGAALAPRNELNKGTGANRRLTHDGAQMYGQREKGRLGGMGLWF